MAFTDAFQVISDRGMWIPQKEYLTRGRLPVVDQGEALIGGFTNEEDRRVAADGPLIVFGDHTRRVKYVDFPFAVGAQGTKLLRSSPGILPRYAYRFLTSVQLKDRGYGRHFALLRKIRVPVPDEREQQQVVDVIEYQISRLDAADHLIETASLRLETLLLSLLSRSVKQMRQEGVLFRPLGTIADTTLGKMLDAKKVNGEATRYLANINVRWGTFDMENLKEVPLTAPEKQRLRLERGDVLACEGGEPGRSAVWELDDSDITYQKALHRIRVLDPDVVSPHFLALMLREGIQSRRWDSLFTGTTIKHLPQEKLRRLEIPVPSMVVQRDIELRAREVERQAVRQAEALTSAKRRSQALQRGVLAAAFAGKLTGRAVDHEVIEEAVHS